MKIGQSSRDDAPRGADPCSQCHLPLSQHTVNGEPWCCACYVAAGHPPADWHRRCLDTDAQLHPDKSPIPLEPPLLPFNDLRAKLHALVGQTVDLERVHMEADTLLLAMLACLVERSIADQIARDFNAIDKWYS